MQAKLVRAVGVWMDHSSARILPYADGIASHGKVIQSPYERLRREDGEKPDGTRFTANPLHASNNEHRKNNIAQNETNEYFKLIQQQLQGCSHILLFGPTNAKEKLHNLMKENKSFANVQIHIKPCDKLTDNQLLEFVRNHFKQPKIT